MNNKWLVIGLSVAIVVLVGVIAFGAYAFTQRPLAQVYSPGGMMSPGSYGAGMMNRTLAGGMMGGRGGFGATNSLVAIAAQDLNLSATDLIAQLQSGKSIADVAKDKNVSTDKIVNDFVAARQTQLKTALDAKQITQAEADATLALVKAHAQAEIAQSGTAAPFSNRALGGQDFPMRRGGGMMGPGGGRR